MVAPRSLGSLSLVLGVLCLANCGRKTDVKPPELVAPEVLTRVSASNTSEAIRVTWERPDRYVDGARMRDLAGFRVERGQGDQGEFALINTLPVTDRDRFQQIKRFRYLDEDVAVGLRYRYRVRSFTVAGHVSDPSNVVEIERAIPPTPTVGPSPTPAVEP